MACPKCGFEQSQGLECMRCGLVFARYKARPRLEPLTSPPEPRRRSSSNPAPPAADDEPPPHVPRPTLSAPAFLDTKYRLDQFLGEGSAGSVYRAVHLTLKRTLAVKVLKAAHPARAHAVARFRREAEALGRLRHPHIVDVIDFGVEAKSGEPYLVMEYLEGETLAAALRLGPLPLERALPLLAAIAEAIDAAHEAGILHRDLKPANVLLAAGLEHPAGVKVLDFGLAELYEPRSGSIGGVPGPPTEGAGLAVTVSGALRGTPLYVAPEVIGGSRASPASDIYSFGVLAYEVLAGHPPFQGSIRDVLAGHLERQPPPVRGLSPVVAEALSEPLQKDPARRPQSAASVVRKLRTAAQSVHVEEWKAMEIPRRLRLAAGLALAIAAIGWLVPSPLPPLELWFQDLLVRTAPPRPPDPRILLVLYPFDPADILVNTRYFVPQLARGIQDTLAAGARGVAVDLDLPCSWTASPDFAELMARYPEALTLRRPQAFTPADRGLAEDSALASTCVWQASGMKEIFDIFSAADFIKDQDGVVRRGWLYDFGPKGAKRPSWAMRAATRLTGEERALLAEDQDFWIDHRVDWQGFRRITYAELENLVRQSPETLRNRLVLIGGDFSPFPTYLGQVDVPSTASRGSSITSFTLQAVLVDTLAEGRPIRRANPALAALVMGLLAGLVGAGILCTRSPMLPALALCFLGVAYFAAAFAIHHRAGLALPCSAPLSLAFLGVATAFWLRERLSAVPQDE